MQAASLALSASAHNVANVSTEGFRRSVVAPREAAAGGVSADVTRAQVPGDALADDLVAQKMAAQSFQANLRSLETADRLIGRLLDVLA